MNNILNPNPTAKASTADAIPIRNTSNPDLSQLAVDHRLLTAPTPKNVAPVATKQPYNPEGTR